VSSPAFEELVRDLSVFLLDCPNGSVEIQIKEGLIMGWSFRTFRRPSRSS